MSLASGIFGWIIGIACGIGAMLLLVLFKTGDAMSFLDAGRQKCACVKLMESTAPPNLSTLYPSPLDAGDAMHKCGKPMQFYYNNALYKLGTDGLYTVAA